MFGSYIAIVKQAVELLDTLSEQEYQQTFSEYPTGSVGMHVRHVIDHFRALEQGIHKGLVDYNVRHRCTAAESSTAEAKSLLSKVISWLESLDESCLNKAISVRSEIDIERTLSSTVNSSVARELVFVSSHAIHHYAVIRLLCVKQNKQVPEFFGYAPATITSISRSA